MQNRITKVIILDEKSSKNYLTSEETKLNNNHGPIPVTFNIDGIAEEQILHAHELLLLSEEDLLTLYWIYDNKIVKRSLSNSKVGFLKSLIAAKLLEQDAPLDINLSPKLESQELISLLIFHYGCNNPLSIALAQLENYVPFHVAEQSEEEIKLEGGYNQLFFIKHPVRYEGLPSEALATNELKKTSANLSLAILKPQHGQEEKIKETKKAMQLLRHLNKKNITLNPLAILDHKKNNLAEPQFINPFVYHGKAGKASIQKTCDLFSWITKNAYRINLADVRYIVAQVLLAISYLHMNDKVHRDIKLENFLVQEINGRIYITLSDTDEVVAHDAENLSRPGAPDSLAPECGYRNINEEKNRRLVAGAQCHSYDIDKYSTVNKKAVDCYAAGCLIRNILWWLQYKKNPHFLIRTCEWQNLENLRDQLMHLSPEKRMTIPDALNHSFFNVNNNTFSDHYAQPEEKKHPYNSAYLSSVKKTHAEYSSLDNYFDGYYQNPKDFYPLYDDAFLLLPAPLKEIFLLASTLENQMKLINSAEYTKEISLEDLIVILNTIAVLKSKLNNFKDEPQEIIKFLLTSIIEIEAHINHREQAKREEYIISFKNELKNLKENLTAKPTLLQITGKIALEEGLQILQEEKLSTRDTLLVFQSLRSVQKIIKNHDNEEIRHLNSNIIRFNRNKKTLHKCSKKTKFIGCLTACAGVALCVLGFTFIPVTMGISITLALGGLALITAGLSPLIESKEDKKADVKNYINNPREIKLKSFSKNLSVFSDLAKKPNKSNTSVSDAKLVLTKKYLANSH